MTVRIENLVNKSHLSSGERDGQTILQTWEKLDREVGIIISQAKKELRPSQKKPQWSPALVKAAHKKRYWEKRWSYAVDDKGFPSNVEGGRGSLGIENNKNLNISLLEQQYDRRAAKELASIIQ